MKKNNNNQIIYLASAYADVSATADNKKNLKKEK